MLLGPAALNLLDRDMLADVQLFIDLAAGMIVFQLGRRIDVRWLLRKTPAGQQPAGSAVHGRGGWPACCCGWGQPAGGGPGSVDCAGHSPAVLLMAVRDLRAEGQVTSAPCT